MNKHVNVILVLIFLSLLSITGSAQSKRAMWVWNNDNQINNMINDIEGYRDTLFAFCKSPHGDPDNKITALFFSCTDAILENQDNLRNFLVEASDSGLTIEFLAGASNWATTRQGTGYNYIQKVIDFNAEASSDKEKFAGIQFDVEPYTLDAWDANKDSVWGLFNTFADSCQKIVDASADTSLYFGIAIPRWYDSDNHFGVNGLKDFQSKIDYVAIMDYVDNTGNVVNDALDEIKNAESLSKKVWVGVETKELDTPSSTFYEEGVVYMEDVLTKATNVFSNYESFEGIAIHSYKYYKSQILTDVTDEPELKTGFQLKQNYPNPFNPSTIIKFTIPSQETAHLAVYDTMGREVATLVNGYKAAGEYEVEFDASGLSSGVYFYRLTAGSYKQVRKMLLLK